MKHMEDFYTQSQVNHDKGIIHVIAYKSNLKTTTDGPYTFRQHHRVISQIERKIEPLTETWGMKEQVAAAERTLIDHLEHPEKYSAEGWTNYATWNLMLWINNDSKLYTSHSRWLLRTKPIGGKITPTMAQDRAHYYFPTNKTPDMEGLAYPGASWGEINWDEIAENWEETRQELIENRGSK